MRLIRLTARRVGSRLITESVDMAGEVPELAGYWDPLADIILACMARDGIIEGGTDRGDYEGMAREDIGGCS